MNFTCFFHRMPPITPCLWSTPCPTRCTSRLPARARATRCQARCCFPPSGRSAILPRPQSSARPRVPRTCKRSIPRAACRSPPRCRISSPPTFARCYRCICRGASPSSPRMWAVSQCRANFRPLWENRRIPLSSIRPSSP